MLGTARGTIVLHISPEAVVSRSVLGVVRDGDVITCDVERRILRLEVGDEDIKTRVAETKIRLKGPRRGRLNRERKRLGRRGGRREVIGGCLRGVLIKRKRGRI